MGCLVPGWSGKTFQPDGNVNVGDCTRPSTSVWVILHAPTGAVNGVHMTKEVLRGAYDLLCLTRPFAGWGMPPSSEVIFRVLKTKDIRGTITATARVGM
jgi:hypothetical protein